MHPAPPMARLRRAGVALVAALSCAVPADAGTVRTKDGLVLEGEVVRRPDGALLVKTADGEVVLPADRVAQVEDDAGAVGALRAALASLACGDVAGRYRVALRAEGAGLFDVARAAHESVVAADPEHAASRRALGYERHDGRWMPLAEARRARGLVLFQGVWRLPAEVEARARDDVPALTPDATLADVMRTAASGPPALARAASVRLLGVDAPPRVATAKALLFDADPRVRTFACDHLAAVGDESALRGLVFSAVRDVDPGVRAAAVRASASFGNDDVAVPFARALASEHPAVVVAAAQALGALGDARAVGAVVRRLVSHGGGVRAVVEMLNKVSYVRDYDVEIAQASNIANPIVGTAVDGVVLDVRVVDVAMDRTVVETALVDAFNRLTGLDAKSAGEAVALYRARPTTWPEFPKDPAVRRKGAITPPG